MKTVTLWLESVKGLELLASSIRLLESRLQSGEGK